MDLELLHAPNITVQCFIKCINLLKYLMFDSLFSIFFFRVLMSIIYGVHKIFVSHVYYLKIKNFNINNCIYIELWVKWIIIKCSKMSLVYFVSFWVGAQTGTIMISHLLNTEFIGSWRTCFLFRRFFPNTQLTIFTSVLFCKNGYPITKKWGEVICILQWISSGCSGFLPNPKEMQIGTLINHCKHPGL